MKHATESEEQIALFEWARWESGKYPELELIHHIPNGGKRNIATAARLKREGVKPGVPDIFLPVPRGQWHGLYIEMKAHKGVLSDNQIDWITQLKKQRYEVVVAYGWEKARDNIIRYLEVS